MSKIEFISEVNGIRIDKMISELYDYSRNQVKIYLDKGHIVVNEQNVKANYKIKVGDVVKIQEPEIEEVDLIVEDLNLNILYEDSDVCVVNKPSGMVVHPAPGHYSGTLVNGLMHQIKDLSGINGELRPGIVHRIDKDTSGLLMVAKNNVAHESLVNQLVNRTVTRRYRLLVHGVIMHDNGRINAPIARKKNDRKLMDVVDGGKEAITNFKVIERFEEHTLVECKLETGRTHQIRVHMRYIGHPLLGDPQYGRRKDDFTNGQFLHAKLLGFIHPVTEEYIEHEIEEPEYFLEKIIELRH